MKLFMFYSLGRSDVAGVVIFEVGAVDGLTVFCPIHWIT